MPRTVDELIKTLDPKTTTIVVRDFFDFNRACYVSSRDKTERISTPNPDPGTTPEQYTNSKAFESLALKLKGELGGAPVLVAACDATHYNFVNSNISYYDMKFMSQNAKTWINKTTDGKQWGMPIQIDHDSDAIKTIGRVRVATPYAYKDVDPENLEKPDGHIEIIYTIPDREAIDKIMDGRYMTMSVSAGANPQSITCSVCGRSVIDKECNHIRGQMYDVATEGPGQTKKRLAFWRWGLMNYREASFVGRPADKNAMVKKYQGINIDGVDAFDNISYNVEVSDFGGKELPKVRKGFTIMLGSIQDNGIQGLTNADHEVAYDELVCKDSITDGSIVVLRTESLEQQPHVGDGIAEDAKCNCDEEAPKEPVSEDKSSYQLAVAGLVYEMLKDDQISTDEAIEELNGEAGIYIPIAKRDRDSVLQFVEDHLAAKDAKLSTEKRKKLHGSTFCGPDRSFPVPDCAHVTAARRLIGRYKGSASTKSRILSCVSRKAKALGCGGSKDSTDDKIQQEAVDMAKFQFETEKELLDSPVVAKVVDELTTSHEQALDAVKTQYTEKEKRFKAIAIDAIIAASTKLNKPLTATLSATKPEEAKTVRDALVTKLEARTLDSLSDTLTDLHTEVAAIVDSSKGDPNQQKVEDALKRDPKGTTTPAAAPEATAQDGKPKEDLNNGEDKKDNKTTKLPSFLRKKE